MEIPVISVTYYTFDDKRETPKPLTISGNASEKSFIRKVGGRAEKGESKVDRDPSERGNREREMERAARSDPARKKGELAFVAAAQVNRGEKRSSRSKRGKKPRKKAKEGGERGGDKG
ncbi:hypothetical protein KM043_011117 [Ampulex compressa]|nr:hypothetical protein KM043_011117 [Ampulex compressa]